MKLLEKATPEDILSLTVQELSNSYEELSLLYRLFEVFSVLSVDEICSRIVDEAAGTIGVRTAAVLFIDENENKLFTKAFLGNWDGTREFPDDGSVLWKTIKAKKPSAFCDLKVTEHRDCFPELSSLMVCPILGKVKPLGALVVADKEPADEFYSNDSKLLMAISAHAGLAIENAFLYNELEVLLLGAIRSLVKTLEASSKWTAGHTERVTEYAVSIGRAMELEAETMEKLKITALLHDIGKIATPKEILNKKGRLSENEWQQMKKHPELGAVILQELRQFKDIIDSIKFHHEHWDGEKGIYGLKKDEIPFLARILAVADAFDALTSDRPYRKKMGKEEAVREIENCSGTQFDPNVVRAFVKFLNEVSQQH